MNQAAQSGPAGTLSLSQIMAADAGGRERWINLGGVSSPLRSSRSASRSIGSVGQRDVSHFLKSHVQNINYKEAVKHLQYVCNLMSPTSHHESAGITCRCQRPRPRPLPHVLSLHFPFESFIALMVILNALPPFEPGVRQ